MSFVTTPEENKLKKGDPRRIDLDMGDILMRLGYDLPKEGSRELEVLEEELRALMPRLRDLLAHFEWTPNTAQTKAAIKQCVLSVINQAQAEGILHLKRKP